MKVQIYQKENKADWDNFVSHSKNGTFLLLRDYMEYHQSRFKDFSLMIYDDKNELLALLPANRDKDRVSSHQGLTYGGLIVQDNMTQPVMLLIFKALVQFLLKQNVTSLIYKTIPYIYHRIPSDEDLYALFLAGAGLYRRDVLTVISRDHSLAFQKRRLRALKKAEVSGLSVKREHDFTQFWKVLEQNLQDRHEAKPVHSLEEIHYLAKNFPDNIKLFTCSDQNALLAGVVIYETGRVAHFQYIGSSPAGRDIGALDFLFACLVKDIYSNKPYIDFGISNENNGLQINVGLIDFKTGFGGRSIAHDYYLLSLSEEMIHNMHQALI